jgi:hypothetical protein
LAGGDVNEASLTGVSRRLNYNAPASRTPGAITSLATVGPYTIEGQCDGFGLHIGVKGPAGTADTMWSRTRNDTTDMGTHSSGLLIPADTDYEILGSGGPPSGNYDRFGGTAMAENGIRHRPSRLRRRHRQPW